MTIDKRIEAFQTALADGTLDDVDFVRRELLHAVPYVFETDNNLYYELKREVSIKFEIHPNDIHIVGSAKLGFSIAPLKLWRPINDESDIDLVIVSPELFDKFWLKLHNFNVNLASRNEKDQKTYERFLEYFFRGWLRPDMFPFGYDGKQEWFEYFSGISNQKFGYYKIACAIFRTMYFFESYHVKNIRSLRGA